MSLIKIADDELGKAIAHANAADEAFEAALKFSGETRYSRHKHPIVIAAYEAKVKADASMHDAFDKSRVIRRTCGL